MNFFIDESGAFNIPSGIIQHHACVAMCVVISDLNKDLLQKKFDFFCSNLPKRVFENGEPKGSKLSLNERIEFCKILSEFKQNILIIPATIDMSLMAMLETKYDMKQRLHDRCIELCEYMLHDSMKEDLKLKAKQFMNLSYQDLLKIVCYARCLFESVRLSILYLSTNGNEDSWNDCYIEIDRSNKTLNSREKIVFSDMVGLWFEAWSKNKPFTLNKEIHTEQHPIVQNFDRPEGLDGREIIKEINWVDSKKSWGLRIADIAASIVFQATNDIDNLENSFIPFQKLMKLSPYGINQGPGLFSPMPMTEEANDLFRVKYRKLSLSMLEDNN